jgi:hypothetical protein
VRARNYQIDVVDGLVRNVAVVGVEALGDALLKGLRPDVTTSNTQHMRE